jgi:hypothetical protein
MPGRFDAALYLTREGGLGSDRDEVGAAAVGRTYLRFDRGADAFAGSDFALD